MLKGAVRFMSVYIESDFFDSNVLVMLSVEVSYVHLLSSWLVSVLSQLSALIGGVKLLVGGGGGLTTGVPSPLYDSVVLFQ